MIQKAALKGKEYVLRLEGTYKKEPIDSRPHYIGTGEIVCPEGIQIIFQFDTYGLHRFRNESLQEYVRRLGEPEDAKGLIFEEAYKFVIVDEAIYADYFIKFLLTFFPKARIVKEKEGNILPLIMIPNYGIDDYSEGLKELEELGAIKSKVPL